MPELALFRLPDNRRHNHAGAAFTLPGRQSKYGFNATRFDIQIAAGDWLALPIINNKKWIIAHRMAITFRHVVGSPGLEDFRSIAFTAAVANRLITNFPKGRSLFCDGKSDFHTLPLFLLLITFLSQLK